jgi:hypothetical protein
VVASRLPAVLVGGALASSLLACGGVSEEERVRETVERFGQAVARRDYQQICDDLISRKLADSIEEVGLPCELGFRRGLQEVRRPRLRIRRVQIARGRALVVVRSTAANQESSQDTLQLVEEAGQWRIAALVRAPATPRRPSQPPAQRPPRR